MFRHRAIKQKTAPSVRKAVVEYAVQAVEDRGVGKGYARPERELDRRNLNA